MKIKPNILEIRLEDTQKDLHLLYIDLKKTDSIGFKWCPSCDFNFAAIILSYETVYKKLKYAPDRIISYIDKDKVIYLTEHDYQACRSAIEKYLKEKE